MRVRRLAFTAMAAVGSLVLASEAAHRIAGHWPGSTEQRGNCAVLVLGSPAQAGGAPTEEQRSRVEAGLRGARDHGCDLMVISGGAVRNQYAEADVMAAVAARNGAPQGLTILREREAVNTWENVRRSLPLLRGHGRFLIASDALHAQRGRRYLCKQNPELCGITAVAAARNPWWRIPERLASSFYELRAWIRDSLLY